MSPVSAFFFSTKQHAENRNATLAAAKNLQAASDKELPTKLSELAKAAKAVRELQAEGAAPQQPTTPGRWLQNPASDGVTAARARVAEAVLPALEADGRNPELVVKTLADVLKVQRARRRQ